MRQTVTALKALYTAMGGDPDAVASMTLIPDLINAIAALVTSGSTATLPAVTSADNGKVLKVTDGAWAVGTDAT